MALGIVATRPAEGPAVESDYGFLVPYVETIPGTEVRFEMIPIPAGKLTIGSGDAMVQIAIEPLWIAKCEVTWDQYQAYMRMYDAFKAIGTLQGRVAADSQSKDVAQLLRDRPALRTLLERKETEADRPDAVTTPTPLYDPSFTYEAGDGADQPAVTMTQFAARQYTKWLSGITGRQFRLPSAAEWEYAARAGAKSPYAFGEQPADLAKFAWYSENSNDRTHPVGQKAANRWGLHDVHGNVAEWVLDAYQEEIAETLRERGEQLTGYDAVVWPTEEEGRGFRGGSWQDDAEACRLDRIGASEDYDWKEQDPNLPKSPWWYTEDPATAVGFRLVRVAKPMPARFRIKAWEADVEDIQLDVADRLEEGRGAQLAPTRLLPKAIAELP